MKLPKFQQILVLQRLIKCSSKFLTCGQGLLISALSFLMKSIVSLFIFYAKNDLVSELYRSYFRTYTLMAHCLALTQFYIGLFVIIFMLPSFCLMHFSSNT